MFAKQSAQMFLSSELTFCTSRKRCLEDVLGTKRVPAGLYPKCSFRLLSLNYQAFIFQRHYDH